MQLELIQYIFEFKDKLLAYLPDTADIFVLQKLEHAKKITERNPRPTVFNSHL